MIEAHVFPPHPDVCTWAAAPSELIGLACVNCGHTNLVHSNPQNRSQYECALCRLNLIARQLMEQLVAPVIVTRVITEGKKGEDTT